MGYRRVAGGGGPPAPVVFGARGVAPAGYALFAFCLGVATGILLRRVLPAMAVTLAVFLPAGAWVIDDELVDAAGNATAVPPLLNSCVALRCSPGKSVEERQACLAKASDAGYRQSISSQPPGHFWRLQWGGLGLFLVLSGGLAWPPFRRIRAMR